MSVSFFVLGVISGRLALTNREKQERRRAQSYHAISLPKIHLRELLLELHPVLELRPKLGYVDLLPHLDIVEHALHIIGLTQAGLTARSHLVRTPPNASSPRQNASSPPQRASLLHSSMLPRQRRIALHPSALIERDRVPAHRPVGLRLFGPRARLHYDVPDHEEVVAEAEVAHVIFRAEVYVDVVGDRAQETLVDGVDGTRLEHLLAREERFQALHGAVAAGKAGEGGETVAVDLGGGAGGAAVDAVVIGGGGAGERHGCLFFEERYRVCVCVFVWRKELRFTLEGSSR
ncbi:hypothetical protein Q7P36_008852 [Cladosporium allicinum]